MLRKAQILTESLTENVFFKYCIFEIKMQYHRRERPLLKGSHNSIKLFRLFEQPEHIQYIYNKEIFHHKANGESLTHCWGLASTSVGGRTRGQKLAIPKIPHKLIQQ